MHEDAVLIGDVIIGPGCYVGPAASLRGDFGRLLIGPGVNIQDTCVMHGFPGTDTIIEENGHIGHGAVVHGCHIKRNALIGMNAVIMDEAKIGENSIVGALSFVKVGFIVPPNSLVVGSPAKIIRELSDKDVAWKKKATAEYQNLTIRCHRNMRAVDPLTELPADRQSLPKSDIMPLQNQRERTPKD